MAGLLVPGRGESRDQRAAAPVSSAAPRDRGDAAWPTATSSSYQGRTLDVTGCQLMRLADGLITEVRGHYSDQVMLDAFWVAG